MGKLKTLSETGQPCAFCKLKEINEFKFGPLFQKDGLVAHYYCVLFSYQMQQRGKDDEGILGFLTEDIKVELNRVKHIVCVYCNKLNASISCSAKKCGLQFHFPCGLASGSLHQFKDSFKSFCIKHRPVQDIPQKALKSAEESRVLCVICQDNLDYKNLIDTIWANCCLTTWYHRDCLQMHALNSGYFFKCAICSNNKKFKNLAEKFGIFVPKKDASWELEPNAFVDLSRQYARCDAENCKCPNGRDFEVADTMWEIILCNSCGSQGVHIMCGSLKFHRPVWQCELCRKVTLKIRSKRKNRNLKNASGRLSDNIGDGEKTEKKRLRDGDSSTSSVSDKKSASTATKFRKPRRTKYARKRKRADTEEKEKSVKRKYSLRDCNASSRELDLKEVADQGSPEKASELNKDLNALNINDFETEKSIENVNVEEKPKQLSNSSEDEDSDDSDDIFPLEEVRRRKKIEEEGLEIIDLTATPSVTDEEIKEVMQVYRNYQINDMKYRVKKEIIVVSDDEPEELEIVDKREINVSQNKAKYNQPAEDFANYFVAESSSTTVSMCMECNIRGSYVLTEKNTSRKRGMTRRKACKCKRKTSHGENGASRRRISDTKKLLSQPSSQFNNTANTSQECGTVKERRDNVKVANSKVSSETCGNGNAQPTALWNSHTEMLNNLEKNVEKIIGDCLEKKKSHSKREGRKSSYGKSNCGSSNNVILGRQKENEDKDVQVIEVISIRGKLSTYVHQERSDTTIESDNEIIELE